MWVGVEFGAILNMEIKNKGIKGQIVLGVCNEISRYLENHNGSFC
jgi:hypothetical protein